MKMRTTSVLRAHMRIFALAMIVGGGLVAFGGGIVTTLPEPDANGWYVFGDPAYADKEVWGDGFHTNMICPRWSSMQIPAGAKIKLVGGVVVEGGLPADAEIDMSELKGLMIVSKGAFGARTITIPAGCYYHPAFHSSVTESGGNLVLGGKSNSVITNDVVLNGVVRQCDHTSGAVYFDGRFSGSGKIDSTNFGKHMYFRGPEFAFTGENSWGSNYGGSIQLSPKHITAVFGKLHCGNSSGTWEYHSSYWGDRVVYDPGDGEKDTLLIDTLSGSATLTRNPDTGKLYRSRSALCLWGGHWAHANTINGSVHFVADTTANAAARSQYAYGYGNIAIDTTSGTPTLFGSTNFNIVVGSVPGNASFNYTAESNAVNTSTLYITNSCVAGVTVKATDIAMLPSVMKGLNPSAKVSLIETTPNKVFAMPLNFASNIVNSVGCDGSGTLNQAPATATLAVTFPTGRSDPKPPRGKIPLAVFDHVGTKLDGWTITLNGASTTTTEFRGMTLELKRDDTGIWLNAKKNGLTVVFR